MKANHAHATGAPPPTGLAPALWLRIVFGIGVGAVALTLFVLTLAPTVTAEDSGELIAAAWHFGIPHPPGYPLWTLLCGLFIHALPVGEIAWRANLFSAVCSAAAAVVAYAAMRQLGLSLSVSASAALVWIWARWSWSQSVIAEVYGLNSLLTAGVLWCVLRWYRTRRDKPLVAAALLLGLGMAHHQLIGFVGLAVLVWVLTLQPVLLKRWRLVLLCVAVFVAGFLPYVYLPIRARANPPMNWDHPTSLSATWAHATRQAYGTLGPTAAAEPRSFGRLGAQLAYMGAAIAEDLTPWLAAAAVLGLLVLAGRDRPVLLLALLWLICTGPLFVLVANFDLDMTTRWLMRVFFIPVPLALAIGIGCLLEWVRTRMHAKLSRTPRVAAAVVALLAVAGPAVQAASHWQRCDYSNYWYARDHAENLLRCMMHGAMVFPSGDYNTFPLVYLTMVAGQRPDVLLAAYSGRIRPELQAEFPPGSPEPVLTWLIKHARRPFYCTIEQPSPLPPAAFVPAGLVYYLKPPQVTFDGAGLLDACDYRNLRTPTVQDLGATMIMIHYQLAKGRDELARGDRAAGLESVQTAAQLGHELKGVLNKAGAILFSHGVVDEAVGYFTRALELDPAYTEPHWNMFQLYKQQARWADARQQLLALLAAAPQDAWACEEMGFLLHEHLNDTAEAVRYWRAALQRNPRLPRARQMLEQLDAGPAG